MSSEKQPAIGGRLNWSYSFFFFRSWNEFTWWSIKVCASQSNSTPSVLQWTEGERYKNWTIFLPYSWASPPNPGKPPKPPKPPNPPENIDEFSFVSPLDRNLISEIFIYLIRFNAFIWDLLSKRILFASHTQLVSIPSIILQQAKGQNACIRIHPRHFDNSGIPKCNFFSSILSGWRNHIFTYFQMEWTNIQI